MKVGVLDLSYRLVGITSVKERRSVVKRLLADVAREGPAFAACEIEPDGGLQRAVVRVAHVSADPTWTRTCLQRVERRLERGDEYELIGAEMEIV